MRIDNHTRKIFTGILLYMFFLSFNCFSQEIAFSASDSLRSYHIITLNDGTVLKGKIILQERKTIQFQDEMIGNITFRTKDICSMEKADPQEYYLITMMNGTALQGKIVNRKENEILLETASLGRIAIDISKIKTIKSINPGNIKDGLYWFKTHIDAHYTISPSAIALRPGEAYFQNSMLLFNSFDVGITNHFSCMGGIVIPFAAFVMPRLSYKLGKGIYIGGGILFADITGAPYGGAAYGQLTFGNRNSHFSIGGGYGILKGIKRYYYLNKFEKTELGLISVSGMKRFSPKYAIVTENWFTPTEGVGVFTGAVRLMGEKSTWDFGLGGISIRNLAGSSLTVGPVSFLSYMRNL